MNGLCTLDESYAAECFPVACYPAVEARRVAPSIRPPRKIDEQELALQRKMEAGLERLLRDIEKLEDAERWDGLS